jgi:membrane protein implicated in regulation of membrane protease activity
MTSSRAAARAGPAEPLAGLEAGKLRKVKPQELAIRFAFGAAISIVAGLVSLAVNTTAGGMFLAFPAILPATITLIEKKESTEQASLDVQGAVVGALGLVVFAVVAEYGLERTGSSATLLAAGAAWAAASVLAYLVLEKVRRRVSARTEADERGGS